MDGTNRVGEEKSDSNRATHACRAWHASCECTPARPPCCPARHRLQPLRALHRTGSAEGEEKEAVVKGGGRTGASEGASAKAAPAEHTAASGDHAASESDSDVGDMDDDFEDFDPFEFIKKIPPIPTDHVPSPLPKKTRGSPAVCPRPAPRTCPAPSCPCPVPRRHADAPRSPPGCAGFAGSRPR